MRKKIVSLLAASAVTITMIPLTGTAAFASESIQVRDDSGSQPLQADILGSAYLDRYGEVVGTLPDGITYDADTNTFTLNGYTGTTDQNVFYLHGDNAVIDIEGENTISFVDGSGTGFVNMARDNNYNLTICGSGTLNLDFSGCDDSFGILGSRVTKIQDCTINITSKNPVGAFHGYTAHAEKNYIMDAGYYAGLEIANAEINIESQMSSSYNYTAFGINVQDSDLSVTDSSINIKLDGGRALGIGAGLNNGTVYGGDITVDSNSEITVSSENVNFPEQCYALYYYTGNLSERNVYTGDDFLTSEYITPDDFSRSSAGRYNCQSSYLEISPHEWLTDIVPATTSESGSLEKLCNHCDKTASKTIGRIVQIKAGESLTRHWTGSDDGFFVIIKDADGNFLPFETEKSSSFKNVGKHKFTVTSSSGLYDFSKTYTLTVVPYSRAISKLTSGTKRLTVTMPGTPKTTTGGSTYKIAYKQKGTSKWKYTTTTSKSKTIKSLKKGKQYYVKVRSYKKVSGTTYYGDWSKTVLSKKIK